MQIAICDDESVFRKRLYEILTCYASEFGYVFNISEFSDGADLLRSRACSHKALTMAEKQVKIKI